MFTLMVEETYLGMTISVPTMTDARFQELCAPEFERKKAWLDDRPPHADGSQSSAPARSLNFGPT